MPAPASSPLFRLALLPLLCLALAAPCPAAKGASSPEARRHRHYTTVRLQGDAPLIDGKLDDACWDALGVWTSGYEQYTPDHGADSSEQTDLKILHDDKNLYVALRVRERDMSRVSVFSGDRDDMVGDVVGVTFDSYHDRRTAFEFDLTAAGQKVDMKVYNTTWDTTWNAVWEGKVFHGPDCWTAEFLIPLSQLRYDRKNPTWGLHSWRWIDRLKEESDWNLLANDGYGLVKSFGELRGLDGLPRSRRVEIVPYGSVKTETYGDRGDGAPGETKTTFKGGLDAKIGLSSSLTLDLSVLPDFGQVEADPSVMNLTAFETFLEEKRTLFLEGKDIFDFPFEDNQVFYSRRIGQAPSHRPDDLLERMPETTTLLGAAKVSGKTAGGWSVGLLASATDEETVSVSRDGRAESVAVEPRTAYVVARVQKDFRHGDTTVGAIATLTSRDLSSDALEALKPRTSVVGGFDFTHYWAEREYYFKCLGVHSRVEGDRRSIAQLQLSSARYFQRPIDGKSDFDPERTSLDGSGLLLEGGKSSKGRWRANEQFFVKTPGLDFNDLGYLSTADRVSQKTELSYIEKKPAAFYRDYTVTLSNTNQWTTHGEFLQSAWELWTSIGFSNKWELSSDLTYTGEARDPVALRGGPLLRVPANLYWAPTLSTDGSRRVIGKLYSKQSRSSEGAYSRETYGAKLSVRPFRSLFASLAVENTTEKDMLRNASMSSENGSPGYFVSRLEGRSLSYALRLQWIIRPELSLQYYGNPFGSTLRQTDFRRVVAPEAEDYRARLGPSLRQTSVDGVCYFDEDDDGRNDFWTGCVDGNNASFRSNLVLKWEYRRGSMLYLVWSQQRDDSYQLSSDTPAKAVSRLRGVAPDNQFLMKMTYWFNL